MCPAVWLSHPCPSVSQGQHQQVPAEGGEVPGEAVGAGKLLWGWQGVVVSHLPALLGQGASTLEEGEQFYDCPTKSEGTGMLSRAGDWLGRLDGHHFPGTEAQERGASDGVLTATARFTNPRCLLVPAAGVGDSPRG